MRLTAWEEERLLVFSAAELARRRLARGVRLNHPEAVAVICDAMLEAARDGASYDAIATAGVAALRPADVLPGVRDLLDEIRLEVLMDDGARLIVLLDPLGRGTPDAEGGPGATVAGSDPRATAAGRAPADLERRELDVRSTSQRVVRVGSHFPFERVNPRLEFAREDARGFRLDIPAGDSLRWAPGETKRVRLVRSPRIDGS